jgi:hypothetical protein
MRWPHGPRRRGPSSGGGAGHGPAAIVDVGNEHAAEHVLGVKRHRYRIHSDQEWCERPIRGHRIEQPVMVVDPSDRRNVEVCAEGAPRAKGQELRPIQAVGQRADRLRIRREGEYGSRLGTVFGRVENGEQEPAVNASGGIRQELLTTRTSAPKPTPAESACAAVGTQALNRAAAVIDGVQRFGKIALRVGAIAEASWAKGLGLCLGEETQTAVGPEPGDGLIQWFGDEDGLTIGTTGKDHRLVTVLTLGKHMDDSCIVQIQQAI